MKNISKILALCLVLTMALSMLPAAFAANSLTAVIDPAAPVSIDLYKYDFTAANKDGILQMDSFVSTGIADDAVEQALAPYAIQGVIFSYEKIANITTYTALEDDGYKDMVLFEMADNAKTDQLQAALGLTAADAYRTENGNLYFTSDKLNDALKAKLADNSSAVKNDLEAFVADSTQMPETDANGRSHADGMEQGLYILVETYVPEDVKNTTAPFFLSLPMTTIDGNEWIYDVTVYPKNETDQPTLEKTLRESADDTGKNGGTGSIDDGYAHTGTGSDGDVIEYQFISNLPTITSKATYLTRYTFDDVLSKGLEYNKGDVIIEWFEDAACTKKITQWDEASGKFVVTYGTADNDATTMKVAMTASGLNEINNSQAVYDSDSIYHGYSDCTIRVTYACTLNSDADVVYGDTGNPNEVTLTWSRTNQDYYDTLNDDCHVYTYGVDLLKQFSDKLGNFQNVKFVVHNDTDNYWVVASYNEDEGIYYVTGHAETEADGTVFVPNADGHIIVKGLEDDTYTVTEIATDDGYILLKDPIRIVISTSETDTLCPVCGAASLTASATIDGNAVPMDEDNGSASALVKLSVTNNKGFKLPETGDRGTMYLTIGGAALAAVGCLVALVSILSRKKQQA